MADELVVREATAEDAAIVAELNAVVQALHHDAHPERFVPVDTTRTTPVFRNWLNGKDERAWLPGTAVTRGWICEDPTGSPLGYVIAVHRETPASPFKRALNWVQLDQVAVRTDARRRGVGRALTAAVVAWAEVLGVESVELGVGEFNETAREFFESMGFVPLQHQLSRRVRQGP